MTISPTVLRVPRLLLLLSQCSSEMNPWCFFRSHDCRCNCQQATAIYCRSQICRSEERIDHIEGDDPCRLEEVGRLPMAITAPTKSQDKLRVEYWGIYALTPTSSPHSSHWVAAIHRWFARVVQFQVTLLFRRASTVSETVPFRRKAWSMQILNESTLPRRNKDNR